MQIIPMGAVDFMAVAHPNTEYGHVAHPGFEYANAAHPNIEYSKFKPLK